MSEFRGALNYYNILDIVNSDSSRGHPENYIEYIVNADKDIILLLVNSS